MEKNKKNLKEKGITLVALIITIIVMLILVGVTVQGIINSDIVGVAEEAGILTETAYQTENSGKVTINGKEYESVDEYINGPAPRLKYIVSGRNITISLADSYENYVANKSKAEKEQEYAKLMEIPSIDEFINDMYKGDRQAFERDMIHYEGEAFGTTTYIDTLNAVLVDEGVYVEEYISAYGDLVDSVVMVTDPAGNESELYYAPISAEARTAFVYRVSENGEYKFTAVNTKGITSEMTVPVELQKGTFTLATTVEIEDNGWQRNPGVEVQTIEFIKGDTWAEFIGETGELVINDNLTFSNDDEIRVDDGYETFLLYDAERNPDVILVPSEDESEEETDESGIALFDLVGDPESANDVIENGKIYYLY